MLCRKKKGPNDSSIANQPHPYSYLVTVIISLILKVRGLLTTGHYSLMLWVLTEALRANPASSPISTFSRNRADCSEGPGKTVFAVGNHQQAIDGAVSFGICEIVSPTMCLRLKVADDKSRPFRRALILSSPGCQFSISFRTASMFSWVLAVFRRPDLPRLRLQLVPWALYLATFL